jgi:hypothetical protein
MAILIARETKTEVLQSQIAAPPELSPPLRLIL